MSRVTPLQVARWVVEAGWSGPNDRITATAIGVATGADPAAPSGVWGVPGPVNDGLGQARAARTLQADKGWGAFPVQRSGRHILYIPQATAAVTAASAFEVAADLPNPVTAAKEAAKQSRSLVDTLTAPIRNLLYLGTAEGQERVGKFIIGSALIVVGGFLFASTITNRIRRKAVDTAEDIGLGVLALRGGMAASRGPARAPAPKPAPRPAPSRARARERKEEEPTREISPKVSAAHGILGSEEARRRGIAPVRGTAKRPPAKLPTETRG